ncbi:pilus motility taxis protein HmpF [Geitlerinema sp. PCC 7407]|uniref:pilus motility taxis protein HmpF n=1 Tax=Geitlerinema sp. PCC 7407 TaxID=1173025 RepID=UPI00029FF8F6|nr:pilus motility taxis protein HmpF [Geitlerinema sp. PCC 7407]AFY67136.1 hypothetical protein GEI7407_2663 [Geitlerinema sp. PCC 7407]
MLYLAEVQKTTASFGLGGKVELKLLACQRSEQNWTAVPGEEVIAAEEAKNFNAGALVLADLNNNRQVKRVQEAGRQLVSILQNFSRMQEKFKTQEEEIEQWKQSLTYQSQELNRREMEMEARREQLQALEEDSEKLEQQRQEIAGAREEADRLREEIERKSQELEGAWEHLRGEMRRLEETKEDIQKSAGLDAEQANKLHEILSRISGAVAPTDQIREQVNQAFGLISGQQTLLDQHWQRLEQKRSEAEQLQAEVDRQSQDLETRWQEWHQAQVSLDQACGEVKIQQTTLQLKQEEAQNLSLLLQNQEDLYQQMYRLAESSDDVQVSARIDLEALDKMPVDELQSLVQDLQRDQDKVYHFVNDQEEELRLQMEEIEALQQKIQSANDYDRLALETELAEEQDRYQMLNETLVGQRRNLRERQEVLAKHQSVLQRRQGIQVDSSQERPTVDLGPVLSQLDSQRQQQAEVLQKLEGQVSQMRGAIEQAQGMISQQTGEQDAKRNELKQWEENLRSQRSTVAELWGQVNLYQEWLQPTQDSLNGLRQASEAIAGILGQFQEASDYQLQAIADMRQVMQSLVAEQAPELAAS